MPALLGTGQIDVVLNGYELTPARAGQMEHTRPYYIYQLVLLGRRDNPRLKSWDDLDSQRRPTAEAEVGVLEASAAHDYLNEHYGDDVEIVVYEGNTDAMREVETGKLDATLADLPAAMFYRDRFAALAPHRRAGRPRLLRDLRARRATRRCGRARTRRSTSCWPTASCSKLYEKYGLWNEPQRNWRRSADHSDRRAGHSRHASCAAGR